MTKTGRGGQPRPVEAAEVDIAAHPDYADLVDAEA